jgi:hopanoid biosynthesis associated RND transporter like protein HpnN
MPDNSDAPTGPEPRNLISRILAGLGSVSTMAQRLVPIAVARPWLTSALGLILGAVSIFYVIHHFALTTDTDALLSRSLPWRVKERAYNTLFPDSGLIVVVIDGKTPELAEQAAAGLTAHLQSEGPLFTSIRRPDSTDFLRQNGLLFQPYADVKSDMDKLVKAQPFIGPLAADPSLRGVASTLSTFAAGVSTGNGSFSDLSTPAERLSDALDRVRAGKPAFFSWMALIGGAPDPHQLRKIIQVDPRLDYAKLQPGSDASTDIRKAAAALGLTPANGVSVRLTGPVPLEDEEFGTLADRAALIGALALIAIITMLWLAVRSWKTIACVLVTTLVGLACAAAFGLLVFGRFNLISVAFIPLFVGLGVDFGIQFSVRFRTEQGIKPDNAGALLASGTGMGRSLTLAAAAISVGFLAFGPTAYIGVSQLGVIAGLGLIFALVLNLSLLPALLRLADPAPGKRAAEAPPPLQRLDAFMLGHRRLVVGTGLGAALFCACLLPLLHFDFNPMHLRSDKAESVATVLDLMKDPQESPNTLQVLAPNLAATPPMVAKLSALPEVDSVQTLDSFIPADQTPKLAEISNTSLLMDLTLNPIAAAPAPTDAELQASLAKAAADIRKATGTAAAPGADALRRLAGEFQSLADGSPALRQAASDALIPGLNVMLNQMRDSLQAQPVTLDTLPADLKTQWIAPDGRARISVIPKGDSNNNAVLRRFTDAVLTVAPDAVGTPISIQQGGATVAGAFLEAGVLSFIAITLLLFAVLRRLRDVAITMAPIVLTGLLTLGSCVLIGQPLNFANIIALPLLFGIGVAFHIYFVMAWRSGGEHLLESSLTRAVFFSALTTATGFGSLWASSHPGTASMGKLLMISLVWTLVSALLFQPALMGPPPKDAAPHA